MLPGPTNLYKCPFCGHEKPLMSLRSGNTFGGKVWSDSLKEYPMLPSLSRVQHCPECGKYFFIDGIRPTPLYDELWETRHAGTTKVGTLNYHESCEAYDQFKTQELNRSQLMWLHLNLLYAFNDWRTRERLTISKHLRSLENRERRDYDEGTLAHKFMAEWLEHARQQVAECNARELSDFDRQLFRENAEWLMQQMPDNQLLHAELMREMGRFDECIALLDAIGENDTTRQFRLKALAHDPEVFLIHFGSSMS